VTDDARPRDFEIARARGDRSTRDDDARDGVNAREDDE